MKLLFYSNGEDPENKRLETAVHTVIPKNKIESFTCLNDFRGRLRRPIESDSIAVLLASNRNELKKIQPLRGLLADIYVVLVIPDRKKSTIQLAHVLQPRFLSPKESDYAYLKRILEKMYISSQHFYVEKISGEC